MAAEGKKHSRRFAEHFLRPTPDSATRKSVKREAELPHETCPDCGQAPPWHLRKCEHVTRAGVKTLWRGQTPDSAIHGLRDDGLPRTCLDPACHCRELFLRVVPGRATQQAAPSGLIECPDCHSRWFDDVQWEWHMPACPKFKGLASPDERAAYVEGTRDAYRLAPGLRTWATCPCGKPARPGNETRTNVYRDDDLVEVRYPHEGGRECCWTREMRR